MDKYDLTAAHEAARFNRDVLEKNSKAEIEEWCPEQDEDEEVTAICPYCGIDAILPESADYPLTDEFLGAMQERWF